MSGPSSATPAPAGGPGSLPPAEPSVSMPQLMKFVIASLGGVVHPSLLPGIVHAAAQSAGIPDIDALMPSDLPKTGKGAASTAKPKRGAKKKDGDAPVSKRAGSVHPFTIFVIKAMERVKDVPEWQNRALGPDGKPVQRGMGMSITGALWKAMSDETREAFNKAYQPLCDQLKSERCESGVKADNVKERLQAYEATFSPETLELIKDALPDKLPPVPSAITSNGALPEGLPESMPAQLRKHVPGAVSSSEEDSDDDDDDDDDDDEKEQGAAKHKGEAERLARAEAERLAREEAERLAQEEEERQAAKKKAAEEEQRKKLLKKEKKEAKEAKKKAADAAAGPSVVAVTPVTEDGKTKKKQKAKDQGADEQTTAKKAKKAAALA